MNQPLKLAATVSMVAVILTACAPNPYWQTGNYNRGGSAAVNRNAVTHTHCGKTHSHVLPPQGLAHHHGDGCMAGNAATRPQAQPNTYRPPAYNTYQPNYQTQYQGTTNPAASTTYGYTDYSGGAAGGNYTSTTGASTYYDYSKPKAPDTTASYGTSSNVSSYYDYTAPRTTSNSGYADTTHSYGASASKPSYNSSTSTSNVSNYAGGNTYTVQKGDTVFQVMRNTGVYWKDIIRLNSLQAPDYPLSPGQQLRLK